MKRILILGKDSYIGENIYSWLSNFSEKYIVDICSTKNYEWKKMDFDKYNTVINCAGIAHINKIKEDMRDLFFLINRDLSIEIGEYAKANGVKHLIVFSSMNVYGDYCDNITDRQKTDAKSFYGQSKLEGDKGVQALEDKSFVVSCIRPPFVYGKGCKGNYNTISRIAKKTPVFPDFGNKKSMIYIDNLCEFIRRIIDDQIGGIYTPQNKELVSTTDLVRAISKENNHKIIYTKLFNWAIVIGNKMFRGIRRAFANDCYSMELSDYYDFEYCIVDFEESIRRVESK